MKEWDAFFHPGQTLIENVMIPNKKSRNRDKFVISAIIWY